MDLMPTAGKMLFALLVLVGLLLVLAYSAKRVMNRPAVGLRTKMIEVIASSYLGVKKSITMVEIPGAVLVIGVTPERISVLHRIEDPETIEEIRRTRQQKADLPFPKQLRMLVSKRGATRMGEDDGSPGRVPA